MERQLLLLGLLRRQEMHGYGLFDFIEQYLAACTDLKKPSAYYLLNKMAESGWIQEEETQEGNRPPRRVYRLTDAGEQAFQELLRDNLSQPGSLSFPGEMGLAFLDDLPVPEATRLLEERKTRLLASLATAQSAPVHPGSLQLILHHRIHFLQQEITWLERLIDQLKLEQHERGL